VFKLCSFGIYSRRMFESGKFKESVTKSYRDEKEILRNEKAFIGGS